MKNLLRAAAPALILAGMVLGSMGCIEGDDQAPDDIGDLHAFSRADALVWNGRVKDNGDLTGDPNTRLLAWTAPGDDGNDGTASSYDIRYLRQSDLTAWNIPSPARAFDERWNDARQFYGERYPGGGGSLEQTLIPRLSPGDTLWFAVKTQDEVGQSSGLSRVAGPFRVPRLSIPLRSAAAADTAGFSARLSGAGDFNRDGHPDLIAGSPAEGRAMVILGRTNKKLFHRPVNLQGVRVQRTVDELLPRIIIIGDPADEFGTAVAGVHKLNSDKSFDVAVGAPAHNADTGAVFIKFGDRDTPATLSASSVDVIVTGESAGDRFGTAVAAGFDLDRDGRSEFLVGAPGAFGNGAVYLFRGRGLVSGTAATALAVIKGEAPGDGFGQVVTSISDVNGDGVPDFAVGAPDRLAGAGAVYIFYGGGSGVLGLTAATAGPVVIDLATDPADVTIRGTAAGRRFGSVIAAAGIVSGAEGYFDFAVSGGDTVYVYFGGLASFVKFPLAGSAVEGLDSEYSARLQGLPGEDFGRSVAGVGDVNRDGNGDLLVGAPGVGAAYIFHGPIYDLRPPDETLSADGAADFGASAAGMGDMNGDGLPDFVVGSPAAGRGYFWF